jgi:DNA-binding Xre family transcriptional regulator
MVRLRITEILEERGITEDWLFRQIGMTDYDSFRKLIHNESSRIRFETISKICTALDVPVGELFMSTNESEMK